MKRTANEIWQLYQSGKNYNDKLNLNAIVNKNERFAAGEQWGNLNGGPVDLLTINIFTRIIGHFVSTIASKGVKFQFTPELLSYVEYIEVLDEAKENGLVLPLAEPEILKVPVEEILNANVEHIWEKMKMDSVLRQAIKDMIITGDAGGFMRWNTEIPTGQEAKGDIDFELVDNTDVFFGNPNDRRVNHRGMPVQPYIIISCREEVYKLKAEADKYKVSKKEQEGIIADTDTSYKAGVRGDIELDNKTADTEKANVFYYFYPNEDGYIHCIKATHNVVIRPDWNIQSKIYPICWTNWDTRKNSYHGQALVTTQIGNQISINKTYSQLMYGVKQATLNKVVYDKTLIPEWNDNIGEKIGINGVNGSVSNSVYNVPQPQMNSAFIAIADGFVNATKSSLGATDAMMGDVAPENTSAIIAVRQASSVPLENPKANWFQFIEDYGYIVLDMMANHYGKRKVPIYVDGQKKTIEFDFGKLKEMMFTIKVDVGDSNIWSETAAVETLSNLYINGAIDDLQLMESMPKGYIPNQQKIIAEKKRQREQAQAMAAQQQQQQAQAPPEMSAEAQMQMPPIQP